MNRNAIFNVAEYEAMYGEIETIDFEVREEESRINLTRRYKSRRLDLLRRKQLVYQKKLGLFSSLYGTLVSLLGFSVQKPELLPIGLAALLGGIGLILTRECNF